MMLGRVLLDWSPFQGPAITINFTGIAPENSGGTIDGSEIRLYIQLTW